MLRIPRQYSHFVYGFIQSGLTCAIAAAIASLPLMAEGAFVAHWLKILAFLPGSWCCRLSWLQHPLFEIWLTSWQAMDDRQV